MSDEARIEAAAKIIDDRLPDVSAGWSFAQQTDFARQMARDALAAADAAGDTVTVSRDDLRAVLENHASLLTYKDAADAESMRLAQEVDRLRAIVEATT